MEKRIIKGIVFVWLLLAGSAALAQDSAHTGWQNTATKSPNAADETTDHPADKKRSFSFKHLDAEVQTLYNQLQEKLQKLPFGQEVDTLYHHYRHGINVPVRIAGHPYIIPLFLSLNTSKRSLGVALESGTLLPKGKTAFTSATVSKDGFDTQAGYAWGQHEVSVQYTHQNLEQYFYKNGWESSPTVYMDEEEVAKNGPYVTGQAHKRQDDFSVSYAYRLNDHWRFELTPTYQYFKYSQSGMDGGNHSHLVMDVQYTDRLDADISMRSLAEISRKSKNYMLRDLSAVQWRKVAEVSYEMGGEWMGGYYDIHKATVGGVLMWEQKKHHRFATFVKAARLFEGPFSSRIESSDLLFGLGIYDRQQRGKAGVAGGISYTYFLVKNQTGLLALMPFFEQAYVTNGGHAYTPHGGVGAILTYQFWRIPWPISLNFTQNLNDGSHHIGLKVGGKF